MSFRYEAHMLDLVLASQVLEKIIISPNISETLYCGYEVSNLFGIPDVVIAQVDGNILRYTYAIELKLSNWKRALEQAFRYRSFANYSYVVLDNAHVRPAVRNINEFQRKNIGLIGLSDSGELFDYFKPEIKKPYSMQFSQEISDIVFNGDKFIELEWIII
ncbi:MAG: hypothetical protein U9R53_08120 [Chloroflexota bacterium]|nr:hypothetical protein [Chloroflexota bacterium]